VTPVTDAKSKRPFRPRDLLAGALTVIVIALALVFVKCDGREAPVAPAAPSPTSTGPAPATPSAHPDVATFSQVMLTYASKRFPNFKRTKDDAADLAEKLIARLRDGDRMDLLIHDFTDDRDDDGKVYNSGTYTIARGRTRVMKSVESAVFGLKPGAVYPLPVDTGVAFLVIRRDN
jgi:hypothetical protein